MTAKRSKFQDIFDDAPPPEASPESSPAASPGSPPAARSGANPQAAQPAAPASPVEEAPRRGRKTPGKSSDPDYTPVTIYLRKTQYQRVQVRMIEMGRKREVSDLVGELLDAWLAAQHTSSNPDV